MGSKKERKHNDLKETENYRRTKTIPNTLVRKGKKRKF